MNFILTSIGLSILTNYIRNKTDLNIYKYSNLKQLDDKIKSEIDRFIVEIKERIKVANNEELKRMSAELNALITFNKFDKNDNHFLLHTDTYIGIKCAEIIKEFLEQKGLVVNLYTANDLNTNSLEEFQIALGDLAKGLSEILQGYKSYKIIFNLTGGFKGINSFLQTMASLYADESIYIFETGDELLRIPKLPITIDENFFISNFKELREIELGLAKKVKIVDSMYIKIEDEITFSAWGELVWQKFKLSFYEKNLLEFVTDKIKYSKDFIKDFESLNPSEKYQINKSLEKLEEFVLGGSNLKSLNYHSLSGQISQKYSNEFYPFDGNDSRRVYCNEKNGKIIIEKIDKHLK